MPWGVSSDSVVTDSSMSIPSCNNSVESDVMQDLNFISESLSTSYSMSKRDLLPINETDDATNMQDNVNDHILKHLIQSETEEAVIFKGVDQLLEEEALIDIDLQNPPIDLLELGSSLYYRKLEVKSHSDVDSFFDDLLKHDVHPNRFTGRLPDTESESEYVTPNESMH